MRATKFNVNNNNNYINSNNIISNHTIALKNNTNSNLTTFKRCVGNFSNKRVEISGFLSPPQSFPFFSRQPKLTQIASIPSSTIVNQCRSIKISIIPPEDMRKKKKKRSKKIVKKVRKQVVQTNEEKEDANGDNWFIFASAYLERVPIIHPLDPDEPWLKNYQKFVDEMPDLFVRYSPEVLLDTLKKGQTAQKKQKKSKAKSAGLLDVNLSEERVKELLTRRVIRSNVLTTDALSDYEEVDQNGKLIKEWALKFFPRTTPYEDSLFTCYRQLDRRLFLIVKKPIEENPWLFPLCLWQPGETLIQSAKRSIISHLGDHVDFRFISHAPEAYYCHHFDDQLREQTNKKGYKIFYYRALYFGNGKDIDFTKSDVTDYAWVTKQELQGFVPELQYRLFSNLLQEF